MATKDSVTPHKNYRSHSDVEPDTPSPSIVQQPKSCRLNYPGSLESSDREISVIDNENILRIIKQQIQTSFRTILQEEIARGNNSLLDNLDLLTNQIRQQEKEIESFKRDLQDERRYSKTLEEKITKLETYSRRDNLLFCGLPEEKGETSLECEKKIIHAVAQAGLGTLHPRSLVRAHRIGRPPSSTTTRPRPILVRFAHFKDRQYTFDSKGLLKRIGIYVEEDFPDEVARRRRQLTPVFWAIYNYTEDGHSYRYRQKVRQIADQLLFNGQMYTVETVHKLPRQFHPEIVASPSQKGITAFFTAASPLSNHYTSPFQIGKETYSCVEQFLMFQKALLVKDDETAGKIMASQNPKEHKYLGRTIKGLQKELWDSKRDAIMKTALEAKFEQNVACRAFLQNTAPNRLAEASPNDRYWGIGLGLRDQNIWDNKQWKGQNKLGEMLMEIRQSLH